MTRRLTFLALAVVLLAGSGCSSLGKTEKGAAIGAAAGAAIGGLIGKKAADKPTTGIIVGAVVGGTAGAIIGRQMDKQAKELEESLPNAEVERVGEGIMVTFESAILFATNSAELSASSEKGLTDLAASLVQYPNTDVVIAGHTDSTGSDDYNQKLSERRAQAAATFLATKGVEPTRLSTVGYGESQAVADNATPEGRQQNRRVEIAIYASEAFQAEAAQQQQ